MYAIDRMQLHQYIVICIICKLFRSQTYGSQDLCRLLELSFFISGRCLGRDLIFSLVRDKVANEGRDSAGAAAG